MSPELVLLIALAVLVALVYRPAWRSVTQALDGRAQRIKAELEAAQQLREEAQSMLAKHQRELHEGEARARAILQHAEEEATRLDRLAREKLEATMQRRTKQAMDRISAAESRALQDIRAQAAVLSVRATETLLREHLDDDRVRALQQLAIEDVRRKLS